MNRVTLLSLVALASAGAPVAEPEIERPAAPRLRRLTSPPTKTKRRQPKNARWAGSGRKRITKVAR